MTLFAAPKHLYGEIQDLFKPNLVLSRYNTLQYLILYLKSTYVRQIISY